MSQPADHLCEADDRPWEEPGSCRMDCPPRRGPLVKLLGTVSFVCGLLSVLWVPGLISSALALAGLFLSVLGWTLLAFALMMGFWPTRRD